MRRLNARAHQAGVRAQGGSELGIDHHAKGTIGIDDVRVDSRHTRYVCCFRLLYVFSCGCLEVTPQGFKNFFFLYIIYLDYKGDNSVALLELCFWYSTTSRHSALMPLVCLLA